MVKAIIARISLVTGAALLPAAVVAQPAPPLVRTSAPAATASAINQIVENALDSGATPGAAVGVARNGSIVFLGSYGLANLEHRAPVTNATVFNIASLTKQFTAAALLLLTEDGTLHLDDRVSKYFPEFPRGSEVTLRQLLNHTSGIHNFWADSEFRSTFCRDRTANEMVDYIVELEKPYDFSPGADWAYSNSGYFVLGAIIEKVSEQPLSAFLAERIFQPLGLRDTAMDNSFDVVPHRASGYERANHAAAGFVRAKCISSTTGGAAGGMRSTASDLLKWHIALFGGKVLSPISLATMIEPARLEDGNLANQGEPASQGDSPPQQYGLGLGIYTLAGRNAIGHGGAMHGASAWVQTFPQEQVTIVALTNESRASMQMAKNIIAAALRQDHVK